MTGRPPILLGILAVQVTRSSLRRTAVNPPTTASAFVVRLTLAEPVPHEPMADAEPVPHESMADAEPVSRTEPLLREPIARRRGITAKGRAQPPLGLCRRCKGAPIPERNKGAPIPERRPPTASPLRSSGYANQAVYGWAC